MCIWFSLWDDSDVLKSFSNQTSVVKNQAEFINWLTILSWSATSIFVKTFTRTPSCLEVKEFGNFCFHVIKFLRNHHVPIHWRTFVGRNDQTRSCRKPDQDHCPTRAKVTLLVLFHSVGQIEILCLDWRIYSCFPFNLRRNVGRKRRIWRSWPNHRPRVIFLSCQGVFSCFRPFFVKVVHGSFHFFRSVFFWEKRTTKYALKLSLQKPQGGGDFVGFSPPLRFSMLRAFWEESSKYVHTQFRGRGFGSDFQIKFWPLFVTKNGILSCFLRFSKKQ